MLVHDRQFIFSPFPTEIYRIHLVFDTYNYFLVYSGAVSVCFRNASGVSDIYPHGNRPQKINPDTLSSPTVSPCSAASTATFRSLIYTLKILGDDVHPCVQNSLYSTNILRYFPRPASEHLLLAFRTFRSFFPDYNYPRASSDP